MHVLSKCTENERVCNKYRQNLIRFVCRSQQLTLTFDLMLQAHLLVSPSPADTTSWVSKTNFKCRFLRRQEEFHTEPPQMSSVPETAAYKSSLTQVVFTDRGFSDVFITRL